MPGTARSIKRNARLLMLLIMVFRNIARGLLS
jgi:hypothetical protein